MSPSALRLGVAQFDAVAGDVAANPRAKAPAATNDIIFLMFVTPELISLNFCAPDVCASGIVVEYVVFARRFDGNR